MTSYDAILIPGGGLLADGTLPPWARARFDSALELRRGGEPMVALSAATPHKRMVLTGDGLPLFEAHAGARYLMERGVAATDIFPETVSWDTIGNAFFARLVHTAVRGWRELLVVTSEFHLERTRVVFDWVFGAAGADGAYRLHYASAPDAGMSSESLAARRERERESIRMLGPVMAERQTLDRIHEWMFAQHGAYAVAAGNRVKPAAAALETY